MGLNGSAGFQPLGGINIIPGALPQAGIVYAIGASKNDAVATISYTHSAPKYNIGPLINYTSVAPKIAPKVRFIPAQGIALGIGKAYQTRAESPPYWHIFKTL
ncbi:hypothetical protein [Candidatus Nitrotoga sp. M5]|uniref:hypothetical protein n=1 Tax=Candidatus Nitrotoga sp. M5 TaxID=2890409 RepID=UPI001EF37C62|nr:hypothetical protein [Candidatus Nitrotoga sp. M5]